MKHILVNRRCAAMAALGMSVFGVAAHGVDVTITTAKHDVTVPLSVNAPGPEGQATLHADGGSAHPTIRAQISSTGPWGDGGMWLGALVPPEASGRKLVLRDMIVHDALPAFRLEEEEDTYLRLFEGIEPILVYNFGKLLPEGVPENHRRSSYVHPIYGLDGEEITDDFPEDHYHHRGLYWAWPYVDYAGEQLDLWVCQGIEPRFDAWLEREIGPACAVFGVDNGWYVGDEEVVDETVWYRVWHAGERGRAIDVDITWRATDKPVTLTGRATKGYGGFCLRFAPREDTVITTDTGRLAEDTLEVQYAWADLSARMQGRPDVSGAAVFIDGDNLGFPNGWLLRHYGFLGVNWPGVTSFTMEPDEPVHVRYRVWVHAGDADEGGVADAYEAFSESPEVTITGE